MSSDPVISTQLSDITAGNTDALSHWLPILYEELRKLARQLLQRERKGHTLEATALVHEVFLKWAGWDNIHIENKAHLFSLAARAMREILIDYARARAAVKRGGGLQKFSLDEVSTVFEDRNTALLAMDQALNRLAAIDELESKIVELRYFGGLSIEETAVVVDVSPATVKREWGMAKAWLLREISAQPDDPY